VSIKKEFEDSLQIEIKNSGNLKAENAVVGLFLGNSKLRNNIIVSEKNKDLKYDFDKENNQLKIYVDELNPFETKLIIIKTKNPAVAGQ